MGTHACLPGGTPRKPYVGFGVWGLGFFLLYFAWAGGELISGAEPPFPSRASSLPTPQPPADLPAGPPEERPGKEPFPKQRAGARPARVISAPAAEGSAGLPSPDYKALTDGGGEEDKANFLGWSSPL